MAWPDSPPTKLREFNQLVDLLKSYHQGHASQAQIEAALGSLDSALGEYHAHYQEALELTEVTDQSQELSFLISESLTVAAECLRELNRNWPQPDQCEPTMMELNEAILQLSDCLPEFTELSQPEERFSAAPKTDELLWLLTRVLDDRLPLSSLESRLPEFQDYHERLTTLFRHPNPLPKEREILESEAGDFEQALLDQEEGIVLLYDYLDSPQEELGKEAFHLLASSGDHLMKLQKTLQSAALKQPTVICVQCGHENSPQARFCQVCQAVLPRLRLAPEAAISLDDSQTSRVVSPYVQEFRQAGTELLEGKRERSNFEVLLEAQRARIAQASERYQRLPPPPEETSPEELELFAEARQAMETGFEQVHRGLELLETFLANPQPLSLEQGLLAMEEGFEEMNKVADLVQSLNLNSD